MQAAAADFFAASALQADVLDLVRSFLGNKEVGQKSSDTAGVDLGAVHVAALQGECGTYVQTCAAADAVEHLTEIGISQDRAASGIVHDDRVEILLALLVGLFIQSDFRSARVHGNIRCNALACAIAGQGPENVARICELIYEFLNTEDIQMHLRDRSDHTAVAFVGHGKDRSGLSYRDVGAGNTHVSVHEFLTHDPSCGLDFFRDDGLVFLFRIFCKVIGDLLFIQVKGRHNHMDRCVSFQSDDELAQVGLLYLYAVRAENLIHMDLFRAHGFGLDDCLDALFLYESTDILHRVFGAGGMVDMSAACGAVLGELLDHLIDVISCIVLDFPDLLSCAFKVHAFIGFCPLGRIGRTEVAQRPAERRILQGFLYFFLQFQTGHVGSLLSINRSRLQYLSMLFRAYCSLQSSGILSVMHPAQQQRTA